MSTKRWSVVLWVVSALLCAIVGDVRAQEQDLPLIGKGVSSDAGVGGTIVLEDKAARTRLEARSLTIDVPDVLNLGVEIGQAAALVQGGGSETIRVRLVATSIVLEDIKGPRKADDGLFSATVTLKSMSKTAFDAIQNLKRDDKQKLCLVPLPEGLRVLERGQVQRLFEHAYIRAVTGGGNTADGRDGLVFVAEIAPGQKTVRVPVKRTVYLLLPTPTGRFEGFEYLSMLSSQDSGIKRVGGLTVIFVSESLFQLESLIEELEPTAKVAAIEVRDAVVLRGTVTSAEQRKAIVEVAEQFYAKVLDQMRQQTAQPNAAASFIEPEGPKTAARSLKPIQQVGEVSPPSESPVAPRKDVLPKLEQRRSALGKLPSLDELQQLRDEVKGLRQDVQRLSEVLERTALQKAAKPAAAIDSDLAKTQAARKITKATQKATVRHAAVSPSKSVDPNSVTLDGTDAEVVGFGSNQQRVVSVTVGDQRTITLGRRVHRVTLFDPEILDVAVLSPGSLRIEGLKPGITIFLAGTSEDTDRQAALADSRFTVVVGKTVTCDFQNEPLESVIKTLAEQSQLNIALDRRGLDEEGIQLNQPIKCVLKDASVMTVLKLILEPLRLAVLVEDGVLVVTNTQRAKGRLVVAVYSVADFIVPFASKDEVDDSTKVTKWQYASQALMELVRTTISPESWSEVGGSGSMKFNESALSLVVRTTDDVHKDIAALLSQLRNLQDTQVALEMSLISVHADQIPKEIDGSSKASSLVLAPTAKRLFVEKWQGDRRSNIRQMPKITLFNGQTATLSSSELGLGERPLNLTMSGVASANHKSVRLSLGINGKSFDTAVRSQHETLQEGQSLIVDITDDISVPAELLKKLHVAADSDEARKLLKNLKPKDGQRILLLVSPRVVVVEPEAEAKLGVVSGFE